MTTALKIGIIGDYNPTSRYHVATDEAVGHAAATLGVPVATEWIPTPALAIGEPAAALERFDALWCSPGSPYRSMQGALDAIRFARERQRPFLGT
jgi:CTP synthase (UTP-ammonia lyase)